MCVSGVIEILGHEMSCAHGKVYCYYGQMVVAVVGENQKFEIGYTVVGHLPD